MTTLLSSIQRRLQLCEQITKNAKQYLENLRQHLRAVEYSFLESKIHSAERKCAEFKINLDTLESAYAVYSTLEKLAPIINTLYEFVNDRDNYSRVADVASVETALTASKLISQYNTLAYSDGEEIRKIIPGLVKDKFSAYAFVIEKIRYADRFSIKLLQYLYDIVDDDRRGKITEILERLKDISLISARICYQGEGVNARMFHCGLTPRTPSLDVQGFHDALGIEYEKDSPFGKFISQSMPGDYGVLILRVNSPTPLEFNIDGLINTEYIKSSGMSLPALHGLNKNIVARFNTITRLPVYAPFGEVPQLFVKRRADEVKYWIIVETLNGITFRILRNRPPDADVTTYKRWAMPAEEIRGVVIGPSGRPQFYSQIHGDRAIEKMFNPSAKLQINNYIDAKFALVDSEPIKRDTVDSIVDTFVLPKVTNYSEFIEALRSDEFLAMLQEKSAQYVQKYIPTPENVSDEYRSGVVMRLDKLSSAYIRAITGVAYAEEIPLAMFKNSSPGEIASMLKSHLRLVLTKAADGLDSRVWVGHEMSFKEFVLRSGVEK